MFCQCNQIDELQIENMPEILPLEIKGNSLETCLENFFSPENIDRTCPQCSSKEAMQVTIIVRNPKIFPIQLKRFEYVQQLQRSIKKHDSILIPDRFQLPCGTEYSLLSIVNHQGETPNSGHYTCHLFESRQSFTEVDDLKIRKAVQQSENITKTAYLLVASLPKLGQLNL